MKKAAKDIPLENLDLGYWAEPILVEAGLSNLEDILETGVLGICRLPKFKVGCRKRLASCIQAQIDILCEKDAAEAQAFLADLDKAVYKFRDTYK